MGSKIKSLCLLIPLIILITVSTLASANKGRREKYSPLKGRKQKNGCNLFQGRWIFDTDTSNPIYDSSTCPFIDGEFDCLKFGRPDKQFLKYSWKPDSCNLPRFDGVELLRKWRGKRVMFIGDSLSLNMWESLGCMIYSSVAETNSITFLKRTPLSSITFQEYGVTLYLYRTPYLVDISKESVGRVLNLEAIEGGADAWKNMDILIFNSWHWWTHKGPSQGWDFIRDETLLKRDMDRLEAFNKGLTTWGKWVDQNVNTSQTRVFFQGISPTHYQGKEWNEPRKTCNGQMEPLSGSTYPGGAVPAAGIVSQVLSSMKTQVYLLDITTLSQLRKDAHPSTYGGDGGTDCSHWCLPGLPDTWNQLLYAALSM